MSIIHRINQHRYVRKYCKCAIQMFTFNNNKTSIKHLFLLTLFGSSLILYFVNQTKIDDIIKMTYFSNNLQTLHIYCYFNLLVFFSKSKIIYRTFNQDCYSKFIGLWWPRTFEQFDRCRCQCWWSTIIRREVVLSRRQQEMELSLELLIQIAPVAHNPQQSLRFPNVRASPPKWPTMYPGFSMGIIKQLVKCPTMPHSMHVQLSKYPSDCQSPIVEQQSMKFDANPRYSKQN